MDACLDVLDSMWVVGDPHNEFGYILEALGKVTPSALLFVGDLDLNEPFAHVCREIRQYVPELTIGYVHGNHDSDSYEKWEFLHDGSAIDLHATVTEIHSVRIAGLGGTFLSKIWHPPLPLKYHSKSQLWGETHRFRDGQRPNARYQGAIYPHDVEYLSRLKADILLTHEAGALHPIGNHALDGLATGLGITQWFHGHHHHYQRYQGPSYAMTGLAGRSIRTLAGRAIHPQ